MLRVPHEIQQANNGREDAGGGRSGGIGVKVEGVADNKWK